MSIKKYYNGAWQNVGFLRRYANGAWQNCSFARKFYNGAWVNILASKYLVQNKTNVNNCITTLAHYVTRGATYSQNLSTLDFSASNVSSIDITILNITTAAMLNMTNYQKLVINADVSNSNGQYSCWFGVFKSMSRYGIYHENTAEHYNIGFDTGVTEFDVSGINGDFYVGVMIVSGSSANTVTVSIKDLYLI